VSERFIHIRGDIWDQTVPPGRGIRLDEAKQMLADWNQRAQECRERLDYVGLRCWAVPAASLADAISRAETYRRLSAAADRRGTR